MVAALAHTLFSLPMTGRLTANRFNDQNHDHQLGEQNGCRQRLEGYLSYQQRLALAVA
jgi:hypothetical protein